MTPEEFEYYKFSKNTEVLHDGQWSKINEVWFDEGLIGIENTGKLVNYKEIIAIKD